MKRSKKIKRALRKPIETFFFRLAMDCIPLLPRKLVVGLTRFAGTATYYVAKRERRTGMVNLDAVFGNTLSAAQKKTILKKSLGSFACTMADIFWFSKRTIHRTKKFQCFTPASGPYFENRAQIIITAHTGNWELIGLESGLLGLDIASIAATSKNASVDSMLNTLRQQTGQTIIERRGALRTLINRFRQNKKAAFLLDQNTPEHNGGVWVDFLGIPTPISSAPAHLAHRTGTEIIFAFSKPVRGGKYEVSTGSVITPPAYDKNQDHTAIVKALTQQIMDVISTQVLTHPEAWLWSYKHWRSHAPGTDPAQYPVYS